MTGRRLLIGTLLTVGLVGFALGRIPTGRPTQRFTPMGDWVLDTKTGSECDPAWAPAPVAIQRLPPGATLEPLEREFPYCSDLYKEFK